MARTKASVGAKVSSGKSSKARCSAAPPPSSAHSSSSGDKSRSYSGSNPVCQRETPKWQKPITNFFIINNTQETNANENNSDNDDDAGTSNKKLKQKRNIIHSDDEDNDNNEIDKPVNKELDETIELEPLTGEQSHKINEYYTSKDKGKGKGKRSNKENIDTNKRSTKRDLEEVTFGEESEHVNKKIKV